jgi:MinD superfamily P-loop ATPase
LFLPGIWCKELCPPGGLQVAVTEIKSFIKRFTGYGKQETITHDPVRCKESCKYNAVVFNSMMNILNMVPEVVSKKCVGCGACMVIYPENCITVNPI